MRQAHADESNTKGHEMTTYLTKDQRKHLLYAFGWHKDYVNKLNAGDDKHGVTWREARRYRDEELEAAGIFGLFESEYAD